MGDSREGAREVAKERQSAELGSSTALPERKATPPSGTIAAPHGLTCLAQIYGGQALYTEGAWWLQIKRGVRLRYDDGEVKTEEERIERPDLQDMLETRYPYETSVLAERRASDPGRARHLELFKAYYGADEAEVRQQLTVVHVMGSPILFHEKGAERLKRVAQALEDLVKKRPELGKYFQQMGGGFLWRNIAGTDRLSAHSFGIAIDLNSKLGAYHLWASTWDGVYPQEIVTIFEREGFIWGGRWKHFDAMHFELRPELFAPGCRR